MINKANIKRYIRQITATDARSIEVTKLGHGVQGAGFLIEIDTPKGLVQYVIKGLFPEGLEHDYPADRAGVFLLDLDEFANLPGHVHAIDVLAELPDGHIKSIGGGREYYLLMERAKGTDYFNDIEAFSSVAELSGKDIARIGAMTSYLANIHSVKKESQQLYWRKIRDTIGHGECLMGVFDTFPAGSLPETLGRTIESKCVEWRWRLKPLYRRLCQVHGDFHPGNIWFQDNGNFVLLDRSRGPWGDSADDVSALTINYIFYSLIHYGKLDGPYLEAMHMFFEQYITLSKDREMLRVLAPFYAFRGAVVANPRFYPSVSEDVRGKIFHFIQNVLDDKAFSVQRINDYIKG